MTRRIRIKRRNTRRRKTVRRMSGGEDPKDSFCENKVCPDSPSGEHSFGEENSAGIRSCYHCYCLK
jgi:hypothetical protein